MGKIKIARDVFGRHHVTIATKKAARYVYLPVPKETMCLNLNKIKNEKDKLKKDENVKLIKLKKR